MHKKGFEYFRISRKMSKLDVTKLLLPFFAIKGFSHYDGSALCRMFGGKKDVLYSYLSQDNINWRNVIYRITNWLLTKVTVRQDHKKSLLPTVLIADDTDLPKTGMHMESIGKIFSHVHQKCNTLQHTCLNTKNTRL